MVLAALQATMIIILSFEKKSTVFFNFFEKFWERGAEARKALFFGPFKNVRCIPEGEPL